MNKKTPYFYLYFYIVIFILCAARIVYSNLPYLLKEPTDLNVVLSDGPEEDQAVDWIPPMGISRRMTESKGLFGIGIGKSYYYAVAAVGDNEADMLLVRGTKNFGDMFDPKTGVNKDEKRIRGYLFPMSDKLKKALAEADTMMKEKGFSFGNGYYVDTLFKYKIMFNVFSGGIFVVLAALCIIAVLVERKRENTEAGLTEKLIKVSRYTMISIIVAFLILTIII